jgi:hypothetical protein
MFIVSISQKSMFAGLNSETSKDGIITYFLGTISLVDTGTDQMAG